MISRLFSSWNFTKTILFVTILGSAIYFALNGITEVTLRTAVRLTARMSGLLFSMAFIASSFNQLAHNSFSKWMLKNRRYIGVSFALVHIIHLGFIISVQLMFETIIPNTKLFTIVAVVLRIFLQLPCCLLLFRFFQISFQKSNGSCCIRRVGTGYGQFFYSAT